MGEVPARGYSWAPFERGNTAALTHGAWSPRRVDPLAQLAVDHVLEMAAVAGSPISYLADPSYRFAVWAWARLEVRIQLMSEWLLDRGSEVDVEGEVLGASNQLSRLESRAESLRARLGLDPLSRARLGRDVAATGASMAQLMSDLEDEEREG